MLYLFYFILTYICYIEFMFYYVDCNKVMLKINVK